jgi:glutamyl-tRNA synthetase
MSVVTRFAPSPTGFLHIGSARTALFNYLFSKHHNGKFLLRIEDTDKERSTVPAIEAILKGLKWLELDWDGEVVFQSARYARHQQVAEELIAQGKAYYCYTSQEELKARRQQAESEGKMFRFQSEWRDRAPSEAPVGIPPVVRLLAPQIGETIIQDIVQGEIKVPNTQLDDMVLLRADKTPTYMFAVVVDDHDMGITHIIRGDDHLTNATRQTILYHALGWSVPQFAHIPLIHGMDGAKMSKRHGALGVEAYKDMGYLPEAMRNYLLRLGWSYGDEEIISTEQAVQWFNLESVGKSPAKFDFKKLDSLNSYYIKNAADHRLVDLITPMVEQALHTTLNELQRNRLVQGMKGLKIRAKSLNELAERALFYVVSVPLALDEKATQIMNDEARQIIVELLPKLEAAQEWNETSLQAMLNQYIEQKVMKLGEVAQILRVCLTGSTISPSIFEIMDVLGKEETLQRIRTQI